MARKCLCIFPEPTEWLKGNVIGSGSFGTVNLAVDTATGALFVVKSARSEAGIAALENEATILDSLDSPYIIKCMGKEVSNVGCGQKRYSLFFEHMGGGSLLDLVEKFGGALNEKVIRLYTKEILLGLKYLHNNGIVHSDVKCKNILIGASGTVKLGDFGCAKRVKDSDETNKGTVGLGGTPLWMAPEVLRNEELVFASDIWSLGCTVIEMATGRPPWGGVESNPMAMMLKIANGNELPEFPEQFSPEGRDFLAKCLDRDPRKRWTSEMLLAHPFVATRKEDVLSPTSVLDVVSYGSDSDSDDNDDDEFMGRVNPLSMKCCLEEKKVLSQYASENLLEASANWITVRSS